MEKTKRANKTVLGNDQMTITIRLNPQTDEEGEVTVFVERFLEKSVPNEIKVCVGSDSGQVTGMERRGKQSDKTNPNSK